MNCFWEEYQRRRWMRPNAHLYARPDAALWQQPNQRLWQAPEFSERKYSPDQPRVPAGNSDGGQWTDGSNAIVLPEIVVSAGGTDGNPTAGADTNGLVQLAGDIPTGDSPEIPKEKPATSRERTATVKEVARQLSEFGLAFATFAETSAWLRTYKSQIQSYRDPPKSLDELQQAVSTPGAGYETHHIVERTQAANDGFPKEMINGPDNLLLIPTMKHRDINGWYQRPNPDYDWETPREYLSGRSWVIRRSVGLRAMRIFGVLKP